MSSRALPKKAAKQESRPRLSSEERVAELLAAARTHLREVGYEKFMPAEVARMCDVSEATVYRYFLTRNELLARVAEEWLTEVLAHEPDLSRCGSTAERLLAAIEHGFNVIRVEPTLTRYILLELRADPQFRGTTVHLLNRRVTEYMTRVVEAAVAAGEYRSDVTVRVIRDMIFGAIEHATWAYLRGEGEFPPRRVAASIASVIDRGMRAAD